MSQWKPDICIYHGNCLDGFGAAWAIWRKWPECDFRPGHYGRPLPLEGVTGKNVLFVDFSASFIQIEALASAAASVVIIDHHKTAEAELAPYLATMSMNNVSLELYSREQGGAVQVVAYFEMERSGAPMAWEFAHGSNARVPRILELIEDRDLWRFRYGNTTRHVAAALQSHEMAFGVWDGIFTRVDLLESEGAGIVRMQMKNVFAVCAESYLHNVGGYTVPIANAPYFLASEVGNQLLQLYPDYPFAATWFRKEDGSLQWSLRSESSRMDVSEIAKRFGGGGHRNAAGYTVLGSSAALGRLVERDETRDHFADATAYLFSGTKVSSGIEGGAA